VPRFVPPVPRHELRGKYTKPVMSLARQTRVNARLRRGADASICFTHALSIYYETPALPFLRSGTPTQFVILVSFTPGPLLQSHFPVQRDSLITPSPLTYTVHWSIVCAHSYLLTPSRLHSFFLSIHPSIHDPLSLQSSPEAQVHSPYTSLNHVATSHHVGRWQFTPTTLLSCYRPATCLSHSSDLPRSFRPFEQLWRPTGWRTPGLWPYRISGCQCSKTATFAHYHRPLGCTWPDVTLPEPSNTNRKHIERQLWLR
jgi:hypothetical protein